MNSPIANCSPQTLGLVFSAWAVHAVFECWLGKTTKVRAASTLELIWMVLVALGGIAAYLFKKKGAVMTTELQGIEGLKAELDLGFAFFGAFKAAESDGKIGLEDLGLLLPLIPQAEKAYATRLQLGAEIKDLSADEAAELATYAAAKLGVVNDPKLVNKVVAVFKALQYNYAAYKAFAA